MIFFKSSKTLCPLPWNHVYTGTDGKYKVCCLSYGSSLYNEKGEELGVKNSTMEEALNSTLHKKLRKDLLDGKEHLVCEFCYNIERTGGKSSRQYELRSSLFTLRKAKKLTRRDGSVSGFPTYLHIGFGNKCNLKCVMCTPICSDFWVEDYNKINPHPFETSDFQWPKESTIGYEDLIENIGSVKRLYITGGEPTISPYHMAFIEKVIQKGCSRNIELTYHTNLAAHLSTKLLELWKEFKSVRLNCSIDGTGATIAYTRYPTKWAIVEKNIKKLETYPFIKVLSVTANIYNLLNLPELIEWSITHGFNHNTTVVNPVTYPNYLSPFILNETVKIELKNYYSEWLSRYPEYNYAFSHLLTSFETKGDEETWLIFLEKTAQLDQVRNYFFNTEIPDMARLLKYQSP